MSKLVSNGMIAALLGVTRQQVKTWYSRRATNHFPEPVGYGIGGERLWQWDDVKSWHDSYVPSVGRPREKTE